MIHEAPLTREYKFIKQRILFDSSSQSVHSSICTTLVFFMLLIFILLLRSSLSSQPSPKSMLGESFFLHFLQRLRREGKKLRSSNRYSNVLNNQYVMRVLRKNEKRGRIHVSFSTWLFVLFSLFSGMRREGREIVRREDDGGTRIERENLLFYKTPSLPS